MIDPETPFINVMLLAGVSHRPEPVGGPGQIASSDHHVYVAHGPESGVPINHLPQARALERNDGNVVLPQSLEHPRQVLIEQSVSHPVDQKGFAQTAQHFFRHFVRGGIGGQTVIEQGIGPMFEGGGHDPFPLGFRKGGQLLARRPAHGRSKTIQQSSVVPRVHLHDRIISPREMEWQGNSPPPP